MQRDNAETKSCQIGHFCTRGKTSRRLDGVCPLSPLVMSEFVSKRHASSEKAVEGGLM